MKKCINCRREYPLIDFPTRKDSKDGRRNTCRICDREKKRVHRLDNNDHYNTRYNRWRKNNLDKVRRARRKNHCPLRQHARYVVKQNIKKGHLAAPSTCSINNQRCCGKVEAHHTDYNKPLDIQWLCKAHHTATHRVFIPEG